MFLSQIALFCSYLTKSASQLYLAASAFVIQTGKLGLQFCQNLKIVF